MKAASPANSPKMHEVMAAYKDSTTPQKRKNSGDETPKSKKVINRITRPKATRIVSKVPPSQLAPACYYDDVRNGTANHGQGAGNSKRGPIFDR
jgi:hypothetical protein